MTLPGEVCVFNLRATCGIPSVAVYAANISGYEAFTLDYDDYDVDT